MIYSSTHISTVGADSLEQRADTVTGVAYHFSGYDMDYGHGAADSGDEYQCSTPLGAHLLFPMHKLDTCWAAPVSGSVRYTRQPLYKTFVRQDSKEC